VKVGVQDNVPLMFPAPAANVAPAVTTVPEAVSEVIAGPSASNAVMLIVSSAFSFIEAVAGAVTTGAPPPMLIPVDAEPDRMLAAVNLTEKEPVELGVQLSVPVVLPPPAVNVAPAVMAVPTAANDVIASPSGSFADTVKVRSAPMMPVAVAGAVTTGARSVALLTRIAVDAEPERAFEAVNVTA